MQNLSAVQQQVVQTIVGVTQQSNQNVLVIAAI